MQWSGVKAVVINEVYCSGKQYIKRKLDDALSSMMMRTTNSNRIDLSFLSSQSVACRPKRDQR
jgi:hypothetical protein